MLGYFGDREVEQFLANPSDAITGSGGVVDLDRKFGGTGLRWNHAGTLAGAPYEFTLGAEYDRMKERRRGYVNVLGERGELRRDEDDLVYSFDQYLIGSWKPTERWQIAGGLRRSEVHFESTDYFIVDINPDDSGSREFESTQPVVGFLFQATPAIGLFASVGKGFETPTFSELAYRPDGSPGMNFALEPAESTNMEAGVKMRLGEYTRLNTTLFRSDTKDDIVTGPAPFPGRNTFVNAERTRREGAEFAASTAVLDSAVTLDIAYTYTRARFEEFVNFEGLDLSGNQVPGVPEHSAYAALVYRHAASGFSAGVEGRWADQVYVNDINSASADSYVVFNLHAGFRQHIGAWQLEEFLRVDNVADEEVRGLGRRECREWPLLRAGTAAHFPPRVHRELFPTMSDKARGLDDRAALPSEPAAPQCLRRVSASTIIWYEGSAMCRYRHASTSALVGGRNHRVSTGIVLRAGSGPRGDPGRDRRRGALRRTPVARAGGGQRTEHDGRGDRALALARSDGPAESQLWQH